jgi:uncharacterized membrane protein HdeD (DUF308 family)
VKKWVRVAAGPRVKLWELIHGIVTVLLGLLIYVHWPSNSVWLIGTLVGVSMIRSGFAGLMLSLAARKTLAQAA